jgi:hypothetical protein
MDINRKIKELEKLYDIQKQLGMNTDSLEEKIKDLYFEANKQK